MVECRGGGYARRGLDKGAWVAQNARMTDMGDEQGSDNRVPLAPGVSLSADALQFTFSRSSGPGGQNVNKLSTRATLTVRMDDLAQVMPADALRRLEQMAGQRLARDPDRIVISASESRSQLANRQSALLKLRQLLVQAMHRARPRRPTRPTRGSKQRRLKAKQQRGQRKAHRREDRDPGRD